MVLLLAACSPDGSDNQAPVILITSPVEGVSVPSSAVVSLAVEVSDPDESDPRVLTLTWWGLPRGANGPAHPDGEGRAALPVSGFEVGSYELGVSVSDPEGETTDASVHIVAVLDADGDGHAAPEDCDDGDPLVHPDAAEICNGLDDDCANGADDGLVFVDWYPDDDRDGYGSDFGAITSCEDLGPDYVLDATDCDDSDPSVRPDAVEECNNVDDDCANGIDDGLVFLDWYIDTDGDGYGDPTAPLNTCRDLSGTHSLDGTDCNDRAVTLNHDDLDQDGVDTCAGDCADQNAAVNPSASEICNQIDDNCVEGIDEGFPTSTWYADDDRDGYGDPLDDITTCVDLSATHVFDLTDCDDSDAALNNDDLDLDGASTCAGDCDDLAADLNLDDVDQDGFDTCAGDCDDQDPEATLETEWLPDGDGDGYGAGSSVGFGCKSPAEGTGPEVAGVDCDDTLDFIHPGAADICGNGVDEDCSGGDQSCAPIGEFFVGDGPSWVTDPPVYSCIETCALVFGGLPTDYHCSTDPDVLDYQAYVDGWGDSTYCSTPVAEDFAKKPAVGGYDCGTYGCSYSAWVLDHSCADPNYCWER